MYFSKGSSRGEIIKALVNLEPGNPESFLTAEIGGKVYDSIQAVKNDDKTYHVEVLQKGGNPQIFDGNKIFALESLDEQQAMKIFCAFLKKRDAQPLPAGAKNITTAAANERIR